MLVKYSKLSDYRLKKIVKCFSSDLTAKQTAHLLELNRNTVNRYYGIFRRVIYEHQLSEFSQFIGEVEVDESYFGPRRVRGMATKRGRGTHRQPVFGIFERNGRVYTEIIPNCARATLRPIITGAIDPKSKVYSDGWRGYDGLVSVGYDKHVRINHTRNEFARKSGVHINGIEAFWSFTKRRLSKFNGVKKYFKLHLKECEWRWKKDAHSLEKELLQTLKHHY